MLLTSIPVPDPTVQPEPERPHRGRAPVAGRPAERLPVPHPLPAGRRSAARPRSRRSATIGAGHFVACHFPIGYAEAPPTAVAETVHVAAATADAPTNGDVPAS